MGQVTVRVNGFTHTIGCRDGEEDRVRALIEVIESKVQVIRQMGGQFSEARMLLHVALLLADELSDLKAEMAAGPAPARAAAPDAALAERLQSLAERMEAIAAGLERA
ncbi:MAG: cell division protein ZapA [Rhodovarius sp.]|nr:cell division protein ZapA [Rhodovarius sp.]MDW8313913.1 cell division protein ZapA [Rhodovarius sp.]